MSTTTLSPSSDYSVQSSVTKHPSGSSAASILSDGSDSTYVSFSSSGGNTGTYVTLGAIPGNVVSISAASITLRCLVSSTKGTSYIQARIYKSDGTTGLCNYLSGASGFQPTTSFSNITLSVSGLDTTLADWSGAILYFSGQADGNSNTFEVSEASVTLTVTLSSPPGAPTGLTVTNDGTNPTTALDLSWTAGTGSPTSYDIQRSTTKGGTFTTLATGVTGTTYTDSSLTAGSEYAYQVAGVNGSGVGSYCSPVAWATEAAAPSGISVSSSTTTSITLALTAPTLGSNIAVDQYVYRYETPVGAGNWTNGSWIGGPYTISSLTEGTPYGIELATSIESTNGDWSYSGGIVGPWSSELTTVTPINAIPARCWIVAARKVDGWTVGTF